MACVDVPIRPARVLADRVDVPIRQIVELSWACVDVPIQPARVVFSPICCIAWSRLHLLYNIIGSSPACFVTKKKRSLSLCSVASNLQRLIRIGYLMDWMVWKTNCQHFRWQFCEVHICDVNSSKPNVCNGEIPNFTNQSLLKMRKLMVITRSILVGCYE